MAYSINSGIRQDNPSGTYEGSEVMFSGPNGVNILITGLTGGSVYVKVHDGSAWREQAVLTYTADVIDYAALPSGMMIRVDGDSVAGTNLVIQVLPNGGF